jgi:hypothetical protein
MSGTKVKIPSDLKIEQTQEQEPNLKKRNETLLKDLETIQKSLLDFEESIVKVEKNIEDIEEEAKKRAESLKMQLADLDEKMKSEELSRFLTKVETTQKGDGDSKIKL